MGQTTAELTRREMRIVPREKCFKKEDRSAGPR